MIANTFGIADGLLYRLSPSLVGGGQIPQKFGLQRLTEEDLGGQELDRLSTAVC